MKKPANDLTDQTSGQFWTTYDSNVRRGDYLAAQADSASLALIACAALLLSEGLISDREARRISSAGAGEREWLASQAAILQRQSSTIASLGPPDDPRRLAVEAAFIGLRVSGEVAALTKEMRANGSILPNVAAHYATRSATMAMCMARVTAALGPDAMAREELRHKKERAKYGADIRNAQAQAERQRRLEKLIDLAAAEIGLPLPAGRKKWTPRLVAEQVFAVWPDGEARPSLSTLLDYTKEALQVGRLTLPANDQ